ncbi:hypothetical protein VSR01_18470 [Actinacidiphila sp. DG2A-62]|uniref:hypothetical protein n=1 Tax=Actinacidiphila sp. DG2A-62 TaxID=3108821 RepID=UPI002DB7ACEB|nr:hypothetical protein [Actinacidiphila sp. DG2A-62]MEC3995408.1 hypothetical protein [Actinacidiphila sp. DG2A-62]
MAKTDPYRVTDPRLTTDLDTADPYRLSGPAAPASGSGSGTSSGTAGAAPDRGAGRGEVARSALWVLVVLSAVANTAASYTGAATWVHLVCGAVTALGGGVLVVRKLRGRR